MRILISTLTIITVALMISCDDDQLASVLDNYEQRLVIDGSIDQGQFAFVALTLSSGYLDDVSQDDLIRSSVVDAKVTVSDGTNEEILTLRANTNGFPELIYRSSSIRGEIGKTYWLIIEYDGEVYESMTTVPEPRVLDSLWFETNADQEEGLFLKGRVTDPADTRDFYRIFTKRKGKDDKFIPMYLSALADNFFDGETLDFTIFRGVQNLNETRDDGFFEPGDTVEVRFSAIDETTFDFWSNAEREIYSFSNPFTSSGNTIQYNVSNNAIGVWAGYASNFYTVAAPVENN